MGRQDSPLQGRLVFLVGARRSGTNWLQRMVCAHPDVMAVPSETHLFSHGLAPLAARFQHGSPGSPKTASVFLAETDMHEMLRDIADRVLGGVAQALAPDARLIVERTPWHVYHLDLIAAVYPDAAVVHIIRDGRDVARSLLSQEWGPTTMRDAAEEWRSSVEAGRAGGLGVGRYAEVRYEEVLERPADELRRIFRFLHVEASDGAVDAAMREAEVAFNTDRRLSAIASGKWRDDLSRADVRTFDQVAGPLLEDLGYEREPSVSRLARVTATLGRRPGRGARRSGAPGDLSLAGMPSLDRPREPLVVSVARMEQVQALLDRFTAALRAGDLTALGSLLTSGALVREVGPARDVAGRDDEARDRFLRSVAEAPEGRPSNTVVETYPGEAVSVIVLRDPSCVGASGAYETLILGIQGEHVGRCTWYRPTE